MATTHFYRYAGWSAYVSAAATIMTFITAIIFFTVGGSFGKINDISSVLQLLFMLPLPLALYRLFRLNARTLNLLAGALGIAGMLVGVVGQSLLVFAVITYQQSLAFFPGAAAIGIWLCLTDYLALASGLFPRGLAW